MNHEFLDHPSDLKIKAVGKSKEEVFQSLAEAVAEYLLQEKPSAEEEKSFDIELKANDLLGLLIQYLNEILFLTETEGAIFAKVRFEELEDDYLKAKAYSSGQRPKEQIKSATYESEIKRISKGFQAVVLFDI
ncbi:MAG: archease [Patescibacteria group bacterium]|nr:archease [Patescibacteria group bacterium]